jgi:hypothetical protein
MSCRHFSQQPGERASLRFLQFLAANILNPHTRRAYSRAVSEFMARCEDNGVTSITAVALTSITAPTPAAPATDPSADYRDHFEALTGLSLLECLHCRSGIMVVAKPSAPCLISARGRVGFPISLTGTAL